MSIIKNICLYDEYADIQNAAAISLIKEVNACSITRMLEIGCGTGNYTRLLTEKFNGAGIVAVDKSKQMIEVAKKKLEGKAIEFIVGDAEDLKPDREFDLITSNAVFQWLKDFERAMSNYKNALTGNGVIVFSMFGPATFWELQHSLKAALGSHVNIDAVNFLKQDEIETIMKRYFKSVIVREEVVKETFDSLAELLNKIRCTGAWGNAVRSILLWKKDAFKKTEEVYNSSFGKIEASYQIFFCKGMK
ncbi:MAG: methyltransferase domain-containing protein [Candidatus Omnitrophota bacterium]|nr:methyltransferase domain-containing protein [Candidatus Omnitrophota bacterium]